MRRYMRYVKLSVFGAVVLSLGALSSAAGANVYVTSKASGRIFRSAREAPRRFVAIVLGARVMPNGQPSTALADRLHAALDLYERGRVERILVTGDHGTRGYNEVEAMYRWLRERDVPREHIFVDHAGFRTFDSMHRAARVFEVTEAIVCTQEFHLARSLFLAEDAGIDAVGLIADRRVYRARRVNRAREFAARAYAVLDVFLLGTEPRHLGDKIPITGSPRASFDHTIGE